MLFLFLLLSYPVNILVTPRIKYATTCGGADPQVGSHCLKVQLHLLFESFKCKNKIHNKTYTE